MVSIPVAKNFTGAARHSLTPIISDGVTIVYNRLTSPPAAGRTARVFAAPHIGNNGLEDLGLLDDQGRLIQGVEPHRTHDVGLDKLVGALTDISGYTVVGTHYSRLVFNGAVPRNLAVVSKTIDGVPIPAYQGRGFARKKEGVLSALYDPFMHVLKEQIGFGTDFVGSLDTFTCKSLAQDCCKQRDMAISIIARNGHSDFVRALQHELTEELRPYLRTLQSLVDPTFPINSHEPVAINKPYGKRIHHRLDALHRDGIVLEVRSDILEHPEIVPVMAHAIFNAIERASAQPQPRMHGQDHQPANRAELTTPAT